MASLPKITNAVKICNVNSYNNLEHLVMLRNILVDFTLMSCGRDEHHDQEFFIFQR